MIDDLINRYGLWDFQADDLREAAEVTGYNNGNDMGTGKTRWAVALDEVRRSQTKFVGPTLVICNMTAFNTPWESTFKAFRPDLKVMVLNVENARLRNASWEKFKKDNYDVLIVHWHALNLLPLGEVKWLHIIGDEIHKICSRKNKWTKKLKMLRPQYKTGLSGTLSKGAPDSAWSPFNWIMPKEFSSYWAFRKQFCEEDSVKVRNPKTGEMEDAGYTKITGVKNAAQFRAKIKGHYCAHKKKERCCPHHPYGVRADMPDKLYDEIVVVQPKVVMDAYHDMRDKRLAWVQNAMLEHVPITAANAAVKMMRMTQFAVSHCTVNDEGMVRMSEPSAKLDALMEKLSEDEEPVVVWSNFKQIVKMAEARFAKAGITYAELTGDIKGEARQSELRKFINGQARVLIGTIATGAESIDGLQHVCDTQIFIDRSWSVLSNQQAEDRLWREGQKNNVHVIDIVARGTTDRGRHQKLEMEWGWIRDLLIGKV